MTRETGNPLDDIVTTLELAVRRRADQRGGDAIDAVLNAPPRTTAVRSLRDAPEVAAFREALIDGLIRADTARQLLQLLNAVMTRVL